MARKNPLHPIDKMRIRADENARLVFAYAFHNGFGRAIGLRHGKLREAFNRFFVLGFGIRALLNARMADNIGVDAARMNGTDADMQCRAFHGAAHR